MAKNAAITGEQKLFGALSYLGILVLIPLLLKKDDSFIQWHAKQGLVVLIGQLIALVIMIIPIFGWVIGPIASFILFILAIIALVNALLGNQWQIPVIGQYASKFNL